MDRYNQGFKYFGPMEQCKDGEWVKYDDVLDYGAEWYEYTSRLEDNRDSWRTISKEWEFLAYTTGILCLIMAATIIYLYTKVPL
jgi:hypothetical protein